MIKRVCSLIFSPCGNVRDIAFLISGILSKELDAEEEIIDITLPDKRTGEYRFSREDLLVIGTPVFAGRVPNKIMPFIKDNVIGDNTWVLPFVSYGNRSFDSALYELSLLMHENSFKIAGAGAFVSEHSFSDKIAKNRPDEIDKSEIESFAYSVLSKGFSGYNDISLDIIPGYTKELKYYTPLGRDGKPAMFLKATPVTDEGLCLGCETCSRSCPMGSVMVEGGVSYTKGICIKCQACIKKCPKGARSFKDEAFLSHVKMLTENYTEDKPNLFLM